MTDAEAWKIVAEMATVTGPSDRRDTVPPDVATVLAAVCRAILDLRRHKADADA